VFEIVGKTPDGRPVVRVLYRFYETTGLPLDVILESLRVRGMMPDWSGFILEAVEAGMAPERALTMLESSIADSYGPSVRDVVVWRLQRMLKINTDEEVPPRPSHALNLLSHEYDAIYAQMVKLRAPSFDELMQILASVVGVDTTKTLQGKVFGMRVVEKLPANRIEPV